ncbi:MAG: MgtC/SapB family protein [Vampirovibrionales bacterium]
MPHDPIYALLHLDVSQSTPHTPWWMLSPITWEAILRITWAGLMGAIVGLERQLKQQSAGLRTHMLVAMGAAVFMILSLYPLTPLGADPAESFKQDPARIAAQIVTGIGFIGGGAVLRSGSSIKGVTTAASLWLMGAVGMVAGNGGFFLSLCISLLGLLILRGVGDLETRYNLKASTSGLVQELVIQLPDLSANEFQSWFETTFSDLILEKSLSWVTPNTHDTTLDHQAHTHHPDIQPATARTELRYLVLPPVPRRRAVSYWREHFRAYPEIYQLSIRWIEADT